jgi:chromosome segregation ATPase
MGLLGKDDKPAVLDVEVDVRELPEFTDAAERIARARRDADAITGDIDSPERYSEATDALKSLNDAIKDTEAARKKVKRPFDDAGKRVQSSFVELQGPAKAAKESLEQRALAFERKRQKEERERREAEEAEARKREAEAKARGEEEEARHAREDVDRATAPRHEVSGARGASGAKASPTSELKYNITDEAALPDEYVNRVPNRGKILEAVRQGIAIPGVQPYRDEKVRVR